MARSVIAGLAPDGTLTLPNGSSLHVIGHTDGGDAITGTVTIDVLVGDAAVQSLFDATFGAGRVMIRGALRPVSS